MKKNGTDLKENFETALKNYNKKDYKNAEIYCVKILDIDPYHFASISLLAIIAAVNKNYAKATELFKKAIEIQPQNITVIHNLGAAYKELGNLKEAINCYKKVLEIEPNHANSNYNLGLVYYQLKDLKTAKYYLKKTIDIQNNYALAFFGLGNVHADLKEYNDAASCYQKTIEINPNIVGAYNNLGLVFRVLNDSKSAINSYKKAIQLKPDHVGAHHNLGTVYTELGEFKKAITSHQMALKLEPEILHHHFYLSDLEENYLNLELVNKIEGIMKKNDTEKENLAYGNFLLSRFERGKKNYQKEFDCLVKAHNYYFDLKKEKFELGLKYTFDDVLQISNFANIEKINKVSDDKLKPIFIVGVPRCGSTLVEKIIGSGSKIISMGEELGILDNYVSNKILERQSLNLGSVADIRDELYSIYNSRGLLFKKNNYIFTDKSLNNFFYLKLIKEIYPSAKIINCKRDVLSSIMSIFQNNLTELAWTHDLNNIFKYFDNYYNTVEKLKKTHSNFIYELEIEKLTNNPKNESKKLMEFCELPWDKKCLEFYKRKDLFAKTASNIQIRKAIYRHTGDKYLPYKKFLTKYGEKYSWYK